MEVARKAVAWAVTFVLVAGMFPTVALAETGPLTTGVSDVIAEAVDDEGTDAGDYSLACVESNGEISIAGLVKGGADLLAEASPRGLSALGVDDDTVEFTYELGNDADQNLVIPPEIEGKAVTAIGESAFESQNWIESVTIPSSVKVIGNSAFKGCAGLRTASLAEGLELIGSYAFSKTGLTSVSVPKTAALASYAFSDCDSLAAVTLPEGVRYASAYYQEKSSSGEWSGGWYGGDGDIFYSCDALASVRIPGSLRGVSSWMFAYCDLLSSVEIAQGATEIGSEAFEGCYSLTSFNIPEGVTSVGREAFYGCKPASTVALPATLASIGEEAFYWYDSGYYDDDDNYYAESGTYEIKTATWDQYWMLLGDPASKKSLYVNANSTTVIEPDLERESSAVLLFEDNGDGTVTVVGATGRSADLVIPENSDDKAVSAIGSDAFKDANWIESVTIPSSVKSIGTSAFRGCLRMKSVSLEPGLEVIEGSAFAKTGLTSVSVPKTAALASFAFSDCDSLAAVTLPEGVRYASAYYQEKNSSEGWEGSWYGDDGNIFYDCDALASVRIPGSLGGVSSQMFAYCDLLASVEIAQGATSIGYEAFDGCHSLESFNIPEGITSVDYEAFYGCRPASPVALPATLASVGERAFYWYDGGYYDEDDNYISQTFSISPSTWEQYWKLLGNKRYLSVYSTTVVRPANAGSAQFDLKTTDNGDGTLAVTGYVSCAAPPSTLEIPSEIDGKVVTAIGDDAFEDANWIESVTVPSSVKTIGDSAFEGTYSMKFATLVEGLELIGSNAFAKTGLESVSVPSSAALSSYAFSDCESLSSVVLPEGVRLASAYYQDQRSGEEDDEGYEYDEYDDGSIFRNCSSLVSIRVPASLGNIPGYMFASCWGLKTAEIAKGIGSIGYDAFWQCGNLQDINLPEGVTSVGSSAFYGCHPASVVALPATLTTIGEQAFHWYGYGGYYDDDDNWVNEASFIIDTATWDQYWKLHENDRYINPDSTEVRAPIGAGQDIVELDWEVNADGETVTITGVKRSASRVVIPSQVSSSSVSAQGGIGVAAAGLAPQAKTYRVVSVGEGAFQNHSEILSVVLPDTMTKIEASAFAGCSSLTDVLIPSTVTEIGDGAFDASDALSFICDDNSVAAAYAGENGIRTSSLIPLTLAKAELTGDKSEFDWDKDGSDVQPSVTVKVGETNLVEDDDYTVIYPENQVGNNYVEVTGTGEKYTGSTYAGYRIIASIENAEVDPIGVRYYDGDDVMPRPTVKLHGQTLREGRDIVYSWANNDRPGTATVTISGAANSPYYGSLSRAFTIKDEDEDDEETTITKQPSISISAAQVQLAGSSFTYTGKQITPAVSKVTVKGVTVPASAYKVAYGSNVNAGVGTVTVTGQNGYTGTASASFLISQAAQSITLGKAVAKGSKTFKRSKLKKAKSFKIGAVASGGGKLTYSLSKKAKKAKLKVSKNGKVTVPKKCKAGTYVIKVKAAATANYQECAVKVTVKVKK